MSSLEPFGEWVHAFDLLGICAPGEAGACFAWHDRQVAHASIATTAYLPVRESTEILMPPFWMYITASLG